MFFAVPEAAHKKSALRWTILTAMIATSSLLVVDVGPAAADLRTVTSPVTPSEAPASAEEENFQRPDGVSAQIAARALGVPVEDLSQRTEASMVKANPDGTWALDSYGLPKFRQNEAGEWLPIDEALTFDDSGTSLVGPQTALEVAEETAPTADVAPLATLTGTGDDAGEELILGWEGSLPAPTFDGANATYSEDVTVPVDDSPTTTDDEVSGEGEVGSAPAPSASAEPTAVVPAEVRVEATRTGFSHFVTLDQAPEGDLNLRFPLTLSEGLTATINDAGTIEIRDAEGELSFYAPKPLMWDSVVNKNSGLFENETAIDASTS